MLIEFHTVDLILIAWDLSQNLLSTGKKNCLWKQTGVHHGCSTKIKSRQASHIIFTSRLETKQGKANKPSRQWVAIQTASLDCLKCATLPEPGFPLTENNHQREKEGRMSGVCWFSRFVAEVLKNGIVLNMKRLYPMSPADKTLSLSQEAVISVQEKINRYFCSSDVLTLTSAKVKMQNISHSHCAISSYNLETTARSYTVMNRMNINQKQTQQHSYFHDYFTISEACNGTFNNCDLIQSLNRELFKISLQAVV